MHIVVCIKQVPDSAQIRVHPVTNTIMRQGVPTIINPYDLFALEAALRLRDLHGGKITVLTMGPPMAEESLRRALSFGPDRAVLLTDRALRARIRWRRATRSPKPSARSARQFGPVDVVFTGKQTIDGDTAQVGPGIAKRLNLNQLTYVAAIRELNLEAGSITVERRAEGGVQVLTTKLPCLITMLKGRTRSAAAPSMWRCNAARAEIVTWSAAAAGIADTSKCGLKGSPTVVKRVFAPQPRSEKAFQIDIVGPWPGRDRREAPWPKFSSGCRRLKRN